MEGLLQVGLERAEASTGDFLPLAADLWAARSAPVSKICVVLRRANRLQYRFLLDRAGQRRTLSGDAKNALATRSWLGGRASQRTAGVNYSGNYANVAPEFLHKSHSVRVAFAAGRTKAHKWDLVCDRRIRNGGGRYSRIVFDSFLPAMPPQSSGSSQFAFYRARLGAPRNRCLSLAPKSSHLGLG